MKKDACEDRSKVLLIAITTKALPVFLTVLSTLLGMVPFLIDKKDDNDFWFTFAVGSMGGLIFSILAYVFVMPILLNFNKLHPT